MIHHPRKFAPQPSLPPATPIETAARHHIHTVQILTSSYHTGKSYGKDYKDSLVVSMLDVANPGTKHEMKLPDIRDIYNDMDITEEIRVRRSVMRKRVLTQFRNRRELHRFAAWCYVYMFLNNRRPPEITPHITSTQISDDEAENSGADRFCGWSTWHHTILTIKP